MATNSQLEIERALDIIAASGKSSNHQGADSGRQGEFAKSLGLTHLQLTHWCEIPGTTNELSTRSRSIIFVA